VARETPNIFAMSVGRDALLPELTGLSGVGVVDLAWPSAFSSVGCGSVQPGTGPLDHGVAFELGEGGHDGDHGFAHHRLVAVRGGGALLQGRSDVPARTAHALRDTAASLAIQAGANPKGVQRMLGHASAAMTLDVYSDLFDSDLDTVADRLDRQHTTDVPGTAPGRERNT
jgi:hypothetical protein